MSALQENASIAEDRGRAYGLLPLLCQALQYEGMKKDGRSRLFSFFKSVKLLIVDANDLFGIVVVNQNEKAIAHAAKLHLVAVGKEMVVVREMKGVAVDWMGASAVSSEAVEFLRDDLEQLVLLNAEALMLDRGVDAKPKFKFKPEEQDKRCDKHQSSARIPEQVF